MICDIIALTGKEGQKREMSYLFVSMLFPFRETMTTVSEFIYIF